MIIKNTPKGRRQVKQLSDYLHEATTVISGRDG
jgi:hypothetical protein